MRSGGSRSEGAGGIGIWILVSLAVHSLLLFAIPYTKTSKSFKIYPLANAGFIELGPSGGKAGGGPDNADPSGTGGGGKAHFLNNAPKKGQAIIKHSAPQPPKIGRKSTTGSSAPDEFKGRDRTTAKGNVKVAKSVEPKDPGTGSKDDPDVMTSRSGKGTSVSANNPTSVKSDPSPSDGRPDGNQDGSGNSGAQGALSGNGGSGKGPGGPGGEGDSPIAGAGEGFVVKGAPPVYPKYAESNSIEGVVGLQINVGKKGELEAVAVTNTSGSPALDKTCVKKIKEEWRFLPVGKGYILDLTVTFRSGLVDYTLAPVRTH